jgi:hypothetical protein
LRLKMFDVSNIDMPQAKAIWRARKTVSGGVGGVDCIRRSG